MRNTPCFLLVCLVFPAWAQITLVDKKADGVDPGVTIMRGAYSSAVSPDGRHLYVPGSLDNGLTVFSIDRFTGALTLVEDHRDGEDGVLSLASCRGVAVSPDGKNVYTAALTDSAVSVFARDVESGSLTFVQALFDLNTGGSFDGLGGAMAVTVSLDGNHVYVAARSDDAIVAFSRDADDGTLMLVAVYRNLAGPIVGLDAPESVILSPDGRHLYVAAMADQAVAAFARNADTGALTFITAYFDGLNGVDGLGCTNSLAISPDGVHVYAVGQFGAPSQPFCPDGFDDWMGVFGRNLDSGELTFITTVSPDEFNLPDNCGGVAAGNGVAVRTDGEIVYATLQWRAAVLVLGRDGATGLLTPLGVECADLSEPDATIDLISAHQVTTDPLGIRVVVTALSPGTALVYETDEYQAFRQTVGDWPLDVTVQSLVTRLNALPGLP